MSLELRDHPFIVDVQRHAFVRIPVWPRSSGAVANPGRRFPLWRGWVFLLLLSFSLDAVAQSACQENCVEVGAWRVNVGMGLGMRSNPLRGGADIPLVLLPEVSYYGERFFLKNLEMGFTLFEDKRHQFNALITPGYDQMYFNRWDPFNFTDGGGFTSGGGMGGSVASSYQVNISGSMSASGESALPATPNAGNSLYVPSAQAVVINDRAINLDDGDQYLFGIDGNPISVQVAGDMVTIRGVAAGDRVELSGVDMSEPADLGRGGAEVDFSGAGGVADRLLISPDQDGSYTVTADAPAAASASTRKIAADQVAHRKMAGLAGFEYSYTFTYASVHLQALSDFTGVHDGHELRAAVIFPWQIGEHKWALTLGGNYKSRALLAYYYGVDGRDTDIQDLHFAPVSAGVERMVRLDWQLPLSERWSLRAMAQYSELPNSIDASPLVSERGVGSAFFGGIYHF